MAGIPISGLPVVVSALLTDIFPAVQAGTTSQETLQQVMDLFGPNIQLGSPSQITGLGQAALKAVSDNTKPSVVSMSGVSVVGHVPNFSDTSGTIVDSGTPMSQVALTTGAIFTGTLTLNGTQSATNDAATIGYVNSVATGLNIQQSCYAGSTANLNATYANGSSGIGASLTNAGALVAFAIDGVSPPLNSRILVKNQTSTFQNGIYTLTTVGSGAAAWVLTRATDYDTAAQINPGDLVILQNGSTLALTSWLQTATVVTIGTDPILFTQFSTSPSSLGQAAFKAVTDNTKSTVASVSGAFTAGHILTAADTAGTVQDGGATSQFLLAANNLSDLTNIPTANNNLNAIRSINVITNLVNSDWGKTIVCTGSSTYSVTITGTHVANQWMRISVQTVSNALISLSSAIGGTINGQSSILLGSGDSITIWDDGTNYWIISSVMQPVHFKAYRNANQSITSGSNQVISFNATSDNLGGFLNTANGRFTPLMPGLYEFMYAFVFAAGGTAYTQASRMFLNGVTLLNQTTFVPTTSVQNSTLTATIQIQMNGSTDYAEVNAFQNSGSSVNVNGDSTPTFQTVFMGRRVGFF